ncbi:Fanconi anemia group A protein homolog, partial [Lingula anatina]
MQADLCSCLRVAASLSPYLFYVDELWSSTFTVATLEASVHLINTYVRNFCCEGIVLPWSLTLYFVRGLLSLCSQRSQSLNSAVLNQGFGKSPLIVVSLIMHYPVVEGALGRELCSSHGSSSEHFVIFNRLRSVYMWATELLGQTLSLEPPCPEPWISGAAIFAVCASAGH